MHANTGEIWDLPDDLDVEVGEKLTKEMLSKIVPRKFDAEPEIFKGSYSRFDDLKAEVEKGEPIVAVSGEVVQRLRLGDRELRRRKQRRR